jgi:hypothetical protein
MDLTEEEKDEFSKELNDIMDSFGYEWKLDKEYIIIDPLKKNSISLESDKKMDKILSLSFKSKERDAKLKFEQNFKRSFTVAKGPVFKEIPIDIFFFVAFSWLLYEFVKRNFGLLGIAIIVVIIIAWVVDLFYSIYNLSLPDEKYLKSRFGFTKEGSALKADVYNIAKKKKNELIIYLVFSLVFISLAILPFFYYSPALVFTDTSLNLIALPLVIFLFFIQYLQNRLTKKDSNAAHQKLTAILLVLILFAVYTFGLLRGQVEVNRITGYVFDLIVIYGVFLFIRDIGKTRKYRAWLDENFRKASNEERKEQSQR